MSPNGKCPTSTADASLLSRFVACTVTFQLGLTQSKIDAYFANGQDYACFANNGGCPSARTFASCPTQLDLIVGSVVGPDVQAAFGQTSDLTTCQTMFTTHLAQFCTQPFSNIINHYCPPPPLLPAGVLAGIIIGGIVVLIFFLVMGIRLRRSWALEREIRNALLDISDEALLRPPPGLGPPKAENLPDGYSADRTGSFNMNLERNSKAPFFQPATGGAPPIFTPGSPPPDVRRITSPISNPGGPPPDVRRIT